MLKGKLWSAEDDNILAELARTMAPEDIAKKLGRTKKAVQQRAVVKNVSLAFSNIWQPATMSDIRKVAEVRAKSRSTAEAARTLCMEYFRVAYLLRLAKQKGLL